MTKQDYLDQFRKFGILPISGGSGEGESGEGSGGGEGAEGEAGTTGKESPPAFKAPGSQEELDSLIASRLARHERTVRKDIEKELRESLQREAEEAKAKESGEFEKLYKAEQARVAEMEAKLQEIQAEIENRDRQSIREKIAKKHNLPENLWDRLKGDDEKSLEADAKALAETIQVKPAETEGGAGSRRPNGKSGGAAVPAYQFRKNAVVAFPDRQKQE